MSLNEKCSQVNADRERVIVQGVHVSETAGQTGVGLSQVRH